MDWTRAVDAYCERLGPGYWAEPVNALTNLAFLAVAVAMWRRSAGAAGPRVLSALLFAIGVGSWLFHTHAQVWAALADTLPILAFILVYIYLANRAVLGWPAWGAALGAAAFVPYAAGVTAALSAVPVLAVSGGYWAVPLLLVIYAAGLRRRAPEVARGYLRGAGLLTLSLVARTADGMVCPAVPLGTHWLWHLLNAAMLGWMIEVQLRHLRRTRGA